MTNLITEKQMNYIIKLDPNKTAEMLKDLSIKEASIMIYKLKKQPKNFSLQKTRNTNLMLHTPLHLLSL